MIRTLCVLLSTAACGSSEPPNCETAIRNAAKRLSANDKPSEDDMAAMVSSCISQKWTSTVRSCVATATTEEGVVSCISGREVEPGGLSTKRSEAELNLNAIEKASGMAFAENGSFVRGSVGPTPATPCCANPGKKCSASSSDWVGVPTWDALMFEMTASHLFQYAYDGDGKTFEARAVGDLDCDGQTVTYVLRGRVVNGNPSYELMKPSKPD